MKAEDGYVYKVLETEHTATAILQYPGSGRIEKKIFRNSVYRSALSKARDWVAERIETHKEACHGCQSLKITVIPLETVWFVDVKAGKVDLGRLEVGTKNCGRFKSKSEALKLARDLAMKGHDVIVEEIERVSDED